MGATAPGPAAPGRQRSPELKFRTGAAGSREVWPAVAALGIRARHDGAKHLYPALLI